MGRSPVNTEKENNNIIILKIRFDYNIEFTVYIVVNFGEVFNLVI